MKVAVFEQNGSGRQMVEGIRQHGKGLEVAVVAVDGDLPELIDDPESHLPESFDADLVLDHLPHADLSQHLVELCKKQQIPVVATGKRHPYALTPFTCCSLDCRQELGAYGEQFGLPEYRMRLDGSTIAALEVMRGAPCGATWEAAELAVGMELEEALIALPREIQYRCSANPSRFDPISGKSPVHHAGHVHHAALEKAAERARTASEAGGRQEGPGKSRNPAGIEVATA